MPWTMDDAKSLYWYVQIGEDTDAEKITSSKLNVSSETTLNNIWKPALESKNISGLTPDDVYQVYVKFEDNLGNETVWLPTELRIMYSEAVVNSMLNLKAECNAAGNQITVSWDAPHEYLYPELAVHSYTASSNGDVPESDWSTDFYQNKVSSYSFTVPQIYKDGIRDGAPVSGVYGYEISVICHNIAGSSVTGPIWIYNIPDMITVGTGSGDESNTVRITSATMSELPAVNIGANSTGKNYVLTRDIEITGTWTSIGDVSLNSDNTPQITNSDNAFKGKLYGNGRTIALSGFSTSGNFKGLFGAAVDAEIRDLVVECSSSAAINAPASGNFYAGALAGYVSNTIVRNVLITGKSASSVLSVTVPSGSTSVVRLGGIIGYAAGTRPSGLTVYPAYMENMYTDLSVSYTGNGTGAANIGGIAGETGRPVYVSSEQFSPLLMDTIVVSAGVSAIKNNSGKLSIGGAVGRTGGNAFNNITYSGGKIFINRGNYAGNTNGGGLFGYGITISRYSNCVFEGEIEVPSTFTGTGDTYIGGIFGNNGTVPDLTSNLNAENCVSRALINFRGNTPKYVGGLAGSLVSGRINNSLFEAQYELYVTGSGVTYAGGFCGYLGSGGAIYGSSYDSPDGWGLRVTGPDTIYAGGFCGYIISGSFTYIDRSIKMIGYLNVIGQDDVYAGGFCGYMAYSASGGAISNCGSGGDISVEAAGDLYAGGFIGYSGNPVRNSYSLSDNEFEIYGSANQYTGGFAGRTRGIISQCWSSVSIFAYNSGSASEFYTGGIAGFAEATSSIENSYSFLYINANKDSGSGGVYSGGITGYSAGTISKCFINGWVYCNSDLPTGDVYAGGIAGEAVSGRLECNVVLALIPDMEISATGGASSVSGRIYGALSGSPVISKNYSMDTLKVIPSPGSPIPSASGGQHGQTIKLVDIFDMRFWLDPDGLAFNIGINNTIQNIWNFNVLAGQGYPQLAWE